MHLESGAGHNSHSFALNNLNLHCTTIIHIGVMFALTSLSPDYVQSGGVILGAQ